MIDAFPPDWVDEILRDKHVVVEVMRPPDIEDAVIVRVTADDWLSEQTVPDTEWHIDSAEKHCRFSVARKYRQLARAGD